MGYVIQEGGLFPHLTARANVALMADYLKRDERGIERRLRELAELCRFPLAGLDRYPVQLSGGERQRVSLMRALMLDPDVLLHDGRIVQTGLPDELLQSPTEPFITAFINAQRTPWNTSH